jgi:hypothetical protein
VIGLTILTREIIIYLESRTQILLDDSSTVD